MHFQNNEKIVKVFYHHPLAWLIREVKILLISLPFYFVAALFAQVMDGRQTFTMYLVITLFFAILIGFHSLFYLMDRLIITNQRILHIDWQGAFKRMEHEAELTDIQDIETQEIGVLSALPIFDYGTFTLETASSSTTILFTEAPDPEGIKHFIYQLLRKPNRIGKTFLSSTDDKAQSTSEENSPAVSPGASGRNDQTR